MDDPVTALSRIHDLPAEQRSAAIAELPPAWRDALDHLLLGPEPSAALQRAISLPAKLWSLATPGPTLIDLLHQGGYPARLMRLLDPAAVHEILAAHPAPRASVGEQLTQACDRHGVGEGLARVRTREYLRLARRELEHGPLEEIGGALSDLAAACVDAAMAGVDPGLREQVVVFGMGKLGGRELNFLSDIDLIFVHADEAITGDDEGEAHRQRTRLHERLRRLLRLLEGSGAWRPLFHVDLRLRPFGTRGPLSISASALERYYERHGRGWERQAWLRARPIAGNLALGELVLDRLAPFVWPRSMAASAFDEIGAMMKRARAQAHRTLGAAAIDLKHDAGGIREIEFFVQSLQLLNGGRHPALRARSTLAALDRLAAAGFISDREHEVLGGAYRVLRRIEHRVQLAEGQQTHKLPAQDGERELLARRLAMAAPPTWLLGERRHHHARARAEPEPIPASRERFDLALAELRGLVQSITGTLTGESELAGDGESEREVARAVVVDPASSPRSRAEALERLGLWPEAAEEAAAMLDHLLARPGSPMTASGQGQAGALALLLACLDSANPIEALRRLVEFTSTRPAHLALWRLIAEPEQQPLLRQLADLFGSSEPLSRGLIGFPGWNNQGARDGGLTLLLEATAAVGLADGDELRERFAGFDLGADATLDDRLIAFKHRELVRIGLYDLGRRPDPLAIGRCLSDLADLVVQTLLADLARGHGDDAPPFTLAVLTLGKFGMQAMDYGSDLDLMFVFDPEPAVRAADAREAAQKVSRRLISRLEDRLRGARLYEVDMRLRPSGRQGLLVSSLDGFRSYHAKPLEVWERLALVRLRGVAEARFAGATQPGANTGTAAQTEAAAGTLCRQLTEAVVASSLWPEADDLDAIAVQTRTLKRRIEDEIARETREIWDVKSGRGGCLELELLVSALQLRHGRIAQIPGLRSRDIPTALAALAAVGALDSGEARALDAGYRFQRLLLNRLRMTRGSGWGESDRLPVNSPRLTPLARRMGLADRDALVSTLERQRTLVRAAFDRHLFADDHAGDH